eukprot:jgi/Picsp_1/3953/NSC_01465-R1_---NA---
MDMGKAIEDAKNRLHNSQSALLHTSDNAAHRDGARRQENKRGCLPYKDISLKKISWKQDLWWHRPVLNSVAKKRARQGKAPVKHWSKDATDRSLGTQNTNRHHITCRKSRSVEDPVPWYGLDGPNSRVERPWQQKHSTCHSSPLVEAWVIETLKLSEKELSEAKRQRHWHKKVEERAFVDHNTRTGSISFIIVVEIMELVVYRACLDNIVKAAFFTG